MPPPLASDGLPARRCIRFGTISDSAPAATEVRAEPFPALAVIRMHHGMGANLVSDSRLGPGDLALLGHPGAPNHMRYESAGYTTVVVPLQAVAQAASNRPDDDLGPLRFASQRPVGAVAARQWRQTIDYVTQNLQINPDTTSQPLLNGATTRLLAATLLTTFPNTWLTEPHHRDRVDATPTTLCRATAFIDANADLDISAVDIARAACVTVRAACVTVRAVQLAFRRHLDSTPTAYLRRVRLDRAHEQLRAATPADGITVADIAARWGYASPGRFTSPLPPHLTANRPATPCAADLKRTFALLASSSPTSIMV